MGPFRLKITRKDFDALRNLVLADMPNEAGAFALAGSTTNTSGTDIIVRRVLTVPRSCVDVQREYRLELGSRALNGLAALCEANRIGAVLCHSHPTDSPYSPSDDHGEHRVFETLRRFMPIDAPTASLLFSPDSVAGRVWLPNRSTPVDLSEIVILGRYTQRINPSVVPGSVHFDAQLYDRQVRAFGVDGQGLIGRAKVGVVGVGGTGSAAAEQLVRLGVPDIVLVDPDSYERSNLTRVYGSFDSTGRSPWWRRQRCLRKVDVVASHLRKIAPAARIRTVAKSVVEPQAAAILRDRDVILLCTDDHWGRAIVNQLAYQYLIPTINVGTSLRGKNGNLQHAVGVLDVLRPDQPCLWCKQALSAAQIAVESMPQEDRQARVQEGYVEGVDTPAPSVVSITTNLASQAVTVFLQLLTDFMGDTGEISRLNYDVLTGTVGRGATNIASRCVCRNVRGFGDLKPLFTVAKTA